MGDSRTTLGDITNIVKPNEVAREGVTEIKVRVDRDGKKKCKCYFEFEIEDECWFSDKPVDHNDRKNLSYALSVEDMSEALEDNKIYLANF